MPEASSSWSSPKIAVVEMGELGNGTVAVDTIQPGELVIVQGGRVMDYAEILTSDYEPFSNHCFQITGNLVISPYVPEEAALDGIFKVNHSCEPTCGFLGQLSLRAMRLIDPGEQITYDYAMTDANWGKVTCAEMRCLCGASSCRRIITGNDWKLPELQKKYEGYHSTFIQSLIDG